MPRTKSFDEQKTLIIISQMFWRNGYIATNLDHICDELSLKKTSIYNAYGSKPALFRKVVDYYVDDVMADNNRILKCSAPISEEINRLLRHFLILPSSDTVSRGCLLTTSLLELQYSEPELFKYVHEQINRIPKGIISYIYAAQERGLLQSNEDPVALGQYLFTLIQGLRVQSRIDAKPEYLDNVISSALHIFKIAENEPLGILGTHKGMTL